ncbi:hypothetical protein, partial [Thermogutta sp.]|uniref:hypothetical protein n=1 Tax=Thermogutta sp. TaxID=1962930 RepID=UPI0025E669F1
MTAGQSGTTLVCECGRSVTVPSWGELSRKAATGTDASAGQEVPYSPLAGWVTGFRWLGLGLIL